MKSFLNMAILWLHTMRISSETIGLSRTKGYGTDSSKFASDQCCSSIFCWLVRDCVQQQLLNLYRSAFKGFSFGYRLYISELLTLDGFDKDQPLPLPMTYSTKCL